MCIRNSYNIHVCQNIPKLRIMYILRYVYADPSQRTLEVAWLGEVHLYKIVDIWHTVCHKRNLYIMVLKRPGWFLKDPIQGSHWKQSLQQAPSWASRGIHPSRRRNNGCSHHLSVKVSVCLAWHASRNKQPIWTGICSFDHCPIVDTKAVNRRWLFGSPLCSVFFVTRLYCQMYLIPKNIYSEKRFQSY